MHHHVGDPAHQVLAVADLGIHHTRGGQYLAGIQVAEVRRDGGRTDIDGNPAWLVKQPWPDAGNQMLLVDRHRDTTIFACERRLQRMKLRIGQREPRHTPFTLEGLEQELHFPARIFKAGLGDLHVIQPCGGIQPDIAGFHLFTHDLSVNLTLRRDINHRIIEQGGVAAEAPAFL